MKHMIKYSLIIFSLILTSCLNNKTLDKSSISKIEIVSCYSLEEIFNGFLIINDSLKSDTIDDEELSLIDQISNDNQFKDYPLFKTFKPYGYFDGKNMTFINSSFLGVISNDRIELLNDYLTNNDLIGNFPTDIKFQYIPSPFKENMSVLIGEKNNDSIIRVKSTDITGFGFEKIQSFDLKGNQVEENDNEKIYSPFLVITSDKLSMIKNGENLIKLTLNDTMIYTSIDNEDLKTDTIFFEYLFSKQEITK
jgi:hypothetical protein